MGLRYTDRMRESFLLAASALLVMLPVAGAAQDKKPPKITSITGCVAADLREPDQLTMIDTKDGTKYRITGKNLREYLGRSVQVDGGIVVKGLRIVGGLRPSPNVAGQAGAIDPSRAIVEAATSESTTGPASDDDVQEFKVKTIKPTSGTWPQ